MQPLAPKIQRAEMLQPSERKDAGWMRGWGTGALRAGGWYLRDSSQHGGAGSGPVKQASSWRSPSSGRAAEPPDPHLTVGCCLVTGAARMPQCTEAPGNKLVHQVSHLIGQKPGNHHDANFQIDLHPGECDGGPRVQTYKHVRPSGT